MALFGKPWFRYQGKFGVDILILFQKTETALEIIKKGKLPENESQEARENIRKALQNAQSVGQKLKEERQNR